MAIKFIILKIGAPKTFLFRWNHASSPKYQLRPSAFCARRMQRLSALPKKDQIGYHHSSKNVAILNNFVPNGV